MNGKKARALRYEAEARATEAGRAYVGARAAGDREHTGATCIMAKPGTARAVLKALKRRVKG